MKLLILYRIPFILLLFLVVSCNDDVLEKLPEDTLSPELFYQDAENLETGLLGIYDALQDNQAFGDLLELDGISDNCILSRRSDLTEFINFSRGVVNAEVTGRLAEYYLSYYQIIQRANLLLENIDAPGQITQAERNLIQAEARFLRALAYSRLVVLYGGVPLVTAPINRADAVIVSRASRNEVVNFIASELEATADVLGAEPFNGQAGRATEQAALAIRARVLLYEARLGNISWEEARSAIQEALTTAENNGAELVTTGDGTDGFLNYDNVFYEANEDNNEILFAVKGNNLDLLINISQFYGPKGGNLSMSLHKDFIDDFYTTDGLPITDDNSIFDPNNPYSNRDPRLSASAYTPGSKLFDGSEFNGQASAGELLTDFALRKMVTLDGVQQNIGELDMIVIRFADLLLMFAEAENEVNGPTAAAYEAINRVRRRVNMPDIPADLNQQEFRNEIIHERRVEFAFEGLRWFDLVTLGIADEQINGIDDGLGRAFVPNQQELFPIPQSEINLNPNLTQNPGYN